MPPCPALVSAARIYGIPLSGIEPPCTSGLAAGDSLAGLITFFSKGQRPAQWLVYLQVGTIVSGNPPPHATTKVVLYSSSGRKLEFTSAESQFGLTVLGPFSANESNEEPPKRTEVLVPEGFLALGLDQAAVALNKLKLSGIRGAFRFRRWRFSETEIETGRQLAEASQLTPQQERALGGALPALTSFYDLVKQTPGLKDILDRVVDKPSIWSVLGHGRVRVNLSFELDGVVEVDRSVWHLPGNEPLYLFPFRLELNNHCGLKVRLLVTAPNSPLLSSGGVVAMLAENPAEPEDYLTLQVVSAKRAGERLNPPAKPVRGTRAGDSK